MGCMCRKAERIDRFANNRCTGQHDVQTMICRLHAGYVYDHDADDNDAADDADGDDAADDDDDDGDDDDDDGDDDDDDDDDDA